MERNDMSMNKDKRFALNHVLLRDDTYALLNSIKEREQSKQMYTVTNNIIINAALQMYAERNR